MSYIDYYKELCPSEESWVHRQLSEEREELEDEIVKLRAEVERLTARHAQEQARSVEARGDAVSWKARAEKAEAELAKERANSNRYKYIAWKSDTNPIMIYRLNDNTLLHGYDADEAIDKAMKDSG